MRTLLLVYTAHSLHTTTVKQHVEGLMAMNSFKVKAVDISNLTRKDFDDVDGIILHYSVRLAFPSTIPKKQLQLLLTCDLPKFNFIQDEYDNTEVTRSLLEQLDSRIVFTCVPQENLELVYPRMRFPRTKFVTVLTGFVPKFSRNVLFEDSFETREVDIGYRGRTIGNRYGRLGFDKWNIGKGVLDRLNNREDVVLDISSEESDRLYGEDWFSFLFRCKSTLATESGSNVFDDLGILANLEQAYPNLTYQEYEKRFLQDKEVNFMGQISPRIFEAIACGTLLILYPGRYSDVIKKNVHYLELSYDFTNIEEILLRVKDRDFWEKMTQRAYLDVVLNPKYSSEGYFNLIEIELFKFFQNVPTKRKFKKNTEGSSMISEEQGSLLLSSGIQIIHSDVNRNNRLVMLGNIGWLRYLWRRIPQNIRFRLLVIITRIIR